MSEDNEREPILLPVPPEELDGAGTVWTGPEREPTELEKKWYRAVARRMRSEGIATSLGGMFCFWSMSGILIVGVPELLGRIGAGVCFILGVLAFRYTRSQSDFPVSAPLIPLCGTYAIERSGRVSLGEYSIVLPQGCGVRPRAGQRYMAEGFMAVTAKDVWFVPVRFADWSLSKNARYPRRDLILNAFSFWIFQPAWAISFPFFLHPSAINAPASHQSAWVMSSLFKSGKAYVIAWVVLVSALLSILIWRKLLSLLEPSPLLSRLEMAPLSSLTHDSRSGEQVFGQELTRSLTPTEQVWLDQVSSRLGLRSRQIGWGLQGVGFAGFVLCFGLALLDHNGDLVGYGIGLLGLLSAVAHLIRRAGRVPVDLPLVRLSGLAGVGLPWDRNCQTIGEFPLLWPEGTPPVFAEGTRTEVDAFLIETPQAVWCAPVASGTWRLPETLRFDLPSPWVGRWFALALNAAWIPALSTLSQGIATWLGWDLQALAWVPWALTGMWGLGLISLLCLGTWRGGDASAGR